MNTQKKSICQICKAHTSDCNCRGESPKDGFCERHWCETNQNAYEKAIVAERTAFIEKLQEWCELGKRSMLRDGEDLAVHYWNHALTNIISHLEEIKK